MATVDDIDTKASVRKFLERKVVLSKSSEGEDSADEIQAVLESAAITFLLNPQAALSLILLAKNTLQQITQKDLELVDFMSAAVNDVSNPDTEITDTSDLVEAQTALVEIDRVGTVVAEGRAFGRYKSAVDRFLDQQLAKTLKRNRRQEFERSGQEARQDLFQALDLFKSTHAVMIDYLTTIAKAVDDFRSVDLTRIVSTKTITRVRSSLRKVLQGIEQGTLSKTVAAVELLAGSAALSSISNTKDIYDPTVETGVFPPSRDITYTSAPTKAFVTSAVGPWTGIASPWTFSITIDEPAGGVPVPIALPEASRNGRPYLFSSKALAGPTYALPAGAKKLYLAITGAPTSYVEIDLGSFGTSASFSALQVAINNALTAISPVGAECLELATGSNRFMIVGSPAAGTTKVTILESGHGSVSGGVFTPAAPSVHTYLGFFAGQHSEDTGTFTVEGLADILQAHLSNAAVTAEDGKVKIESDIDTPQSTVQVSTSPAGFGFPSSIAVASPESIVLREDGAEVSPGSVGILVGSVVVATDQVDHNRNLLSNITGFDGNDLLFDPSVLLPRGVDRPVTVLAPTVFLVQKLIRGLAPLVGTFSDDGLVLQRVLSPLLSRPTLAQVADARRALEELRGRLSNQNSSGLLDLLTAIVIRDDQAEFAKFAQIIVAGMEEKGMDRASDLLKRGRFSEFFALSKEAASKSGRFLKAIEDVGRTDLGTSTVESQIEDVRPVGTVPDDVLEGQQTSEDV